MPVKTSTGKNLQDFNLIIPLRDTSNNVVTWENRVEIMPRYTSSTTAANKSFTASGDYADASNHNSSGSGWSYDFELNDMPPSPGPWYNYTYDTGAGRRGSSSSANNGTALNDHGTYMSLYMDIHVGDGPHPGVGTNYAHISLLYNQHGAYHQYQYTGSSTADYTQARTWFDHTSGNQNIKIAGQNYGGRLYSQIFCFGDLQNRSYNGCRYLRFINHGGSTSGTSRCTVTGGQVVIHGRNGSNSNADK